MSDHYVLSKRGRERASKLRDPETRALWKREGAEHDRRQAHMGIAEKDRDPMIPMRINVGPSAK